mmetsp:Transcript_6546/g.11475  ORF Transcript_6546/g.11475 Transcript_6546/m.11475 type:complete len:778 (+) Transcript_6546:3890-6223(+)
MRLEDDEDIVQKSNEPKLACRPDSFGYTTEEALEVFPLGNYPRCTEKFPGHKQALFLDYETNLLTMNCSGKFPGKYVLGLDSRNESIILDSQFNNTAQLYRGPVELKGEEWAIGTCDPDKTNLFEQAYYKPRISKIVKARVTNTMNSVMKSLDKYRNIERKPAQKLIILILTVDSASRRHFYRKLPKTVDFLNNLDASQHRVYDFKIHNVIGDNSARNSVPLFTGKQRLNYKGDKEKDGTPGGFFNGDALKRHSLYFYMSEMGFTTLLAFEFCAHYFAGYIGDKPWVDHLVANFWCGAKLYSGYSFEKSVLGQRCIGPKMSHSYLLDYVTEFSKGYGVNNQFIYTHITTGHEATGTHIETLDEDLTDFLQNYLELANQQNTEVAIMIQGDHGMRYGEWYKSNDAFQEHRLPAFFFLLSTSLLKRVEYSLDTLDYNTRRLVGKLDLHLTMKHLAAMPYFYDIERGGSDYSWWKLFPYQETAVSLLLEKIPNSRTCDQIFIPSFWCSCMTMHSISANDYRRSRALRLLIDQFTGYVVEVMNSEVYTTSRGYKDLICRRVSIREITSVFVQKVTSRDEAFKIEFTILEHPTARFEAYIVLGITNKFVGIKEDATDAFPTIPVYYLGRKVKARLLFLKRLDKYAGLCEEIATERHINPALCICHPLSHIAAQMPSVLTSIQDKTKPRLSQVPGMSCESACKSWKMECNEVYGELLNSCKVIKELVLESWDEEVTVTCRSGEHLSVIRNGIEAIAFLHSNSDYSDVCEWQPPADVFAACPCE